MERGREREIEREVWLMKLVEKEKRRKKKGKRLKWQIAKDEMSLVVRVVRMSGWTYIDRSKRGGGVKMEIHL